MARRTLPRHRGAGGHATSARLRLANEARLKDWAETARASDLPNVHAFARGLDLDIDAAIAAISLPFHNGRTEGVNTKTKMIKRQMYGRAGFALLRKRVILHPALPDHKIRGRASCRGLRRHK